MDNRAKLDITSLAPGTAFSIDRECRAASRPAPNHKPQMQFEPRVRLSPVWADPTALCQATVADPLHLRDVVCGRRPASD